MARRIPSLRPATAWITIVAFLALCATTLVLTPASTQAKPSSTEINPGEGSGGLMIPGHGDDDQPTMAPSSPRRQMASVSEPHSSASGSGTQDRGSFIDLVRRLFSRGQIILKRLANIAP